MLQITPTCTVPPYLGGSPCPNHPPRVPFQPWPLPSRTARDLGAYVGVLNLRVDS